MGVTVTMGSTQERFAVLEARLRPMGINGYVSWLAGAALHYLQNQSQARFKRNEPGGGAWPGLTEATANWRTWYGYGAYAPINRRTGQLRDLMTAGAPDVGMDPLGAYLSYPGRQGERADNQIRLQQAQGTLQQRNGSMSTPRPVVVVEPADVLALGYSLQQWILGKGGSRR